ncbi:MAG: hypothetical protein WCR54_06780 [Clostridia bacterium]
MKQQTTQKKKIIDIVITCLEAVIVIFAITLSAIVIANPITSSTEVSKGNTKLLPVLSESMNGTDEFYEANPEFAKIGKFQKGDLIIANNPEKAEPLVIGDMITYVGNVAGTQALITHRIVAITTNDDGVATEYIVQGDNRVTNPRTEQVAAGDVLAVYNYSLGGVGGAINWLQNSTNFLLVVVLPLIALFIYNIVAFVLMITKAKAAKQLEENASVNAIDEEKLKQKAVEEYLASQKKVEPIDDGDKVAPAKVTPAKVVSVEVAPVEVAPAKVAPAKVAPAKVAPAKKAPVKKAPAKVAETKKEDNKENK